MAAKAGRSISFAAAIAVYVVDQPGRGRSAYVKEVYGEPRFADAESAQRRYMQQEKFKLWPQAEKHTQWPGTGEIDDPATRQIIGSFLPEIDLQQVSSRSPTRRWSRSPTSSGPSSC